MGAKSPYDTDLRSPRNLQSNAGKVLTGYFGSLPGGLLKHLGRGYSDFCAALVAVGTNAKELQVCSDPGPVCTSC